MSGSGEPVDEEFLKVRVWEKGIRFSVEFGPHLEVQRHLLVYEVDIVSI